MLVEWKEKDIKRNTILIPAFYHVTVVGVSEKLAASQKSTNVMVELSIVKNLDAGTTEECEGVPAMMFFNSLAMGKAMSLANAVSDEGDEAVAGGRFNFTEEALSGKEFEVFIGNSVNQKTNQMQNEVSEQCRRLGAAA